MLITGIGGGVALQALQLCRAMDADVYVISGSQAKIDRAVALGGVQRAVDVLDQDDAALRDRRDRELEEAVIHAASAARAILR